MTQLFSTITSWIYMQAPGAYVWGPSRAGKTRAIRTLAPSLSNRLDEPVFAHLFVATAYTTTTDNKIWGDMLRSLKHPIASSSHAIDKFWTLVALLADQAAQNSTRQVVLFIDNAEEWDSRSYRFLKGLFNVLVQQGVAPCFISVGAPEFHEWVNDLKGPTSPQLKGRFFATAHRFTGLTCANDVKNALEQYDDGHARSHIGDQCATRSYVPKAFSSGFRLAAYSDLIWQQFTDHAGSRSAEWPMQYFTSWVTCSVVDLLSRKDDVELLFEEADIDIGLRRMGMPG